MRSERYEGFTLAELLVVVAIIGIVAAVAMPLLSSGDSKKLEVAAEEVGNALRFAVNEARRTESYILVDAKTVPGRLKIVTSNATGADLGPVNDPLTKRALDVDVEEGAFSGSVSMIPTFIGGVTPYQQLLIGPKCCTSGQLQAFDGPSANMGALQSNSCIMLSLGSPSPPCMPWPPSAPGAPSVRVTIDETTGFVAMP
jgi:prepilin-type N-terminal cleavage/methylation domain-containing protein